MEVPDAYVPIEFVGGEIDEEVENPSSEVEGVGATLEIDFLCRESMEELEDSDPTEVDMTYGGDSIDRKSVV